jgi:hypothetical protein
MRRPDFDAVSGVSTGALLAPFAYVGTDEACLQVENFLPQPEERLGARAGSALLSSRQSLVHDDPGLDRDLRAAFNKEFIAQMAEQSRAGKFWPSAPPIWTSAASVSGPSARKRKPRKPVVIRIAW